MFGLGILCASSLVYLVAISLYRFYFHPLAKFPGPVINAISDVSRKNPIPSKARLMRLSCQE